MTRRRSASASASATPAGPSLHPGSAWILQQTVGQGSGNGQFNSPDQVAIDPSGNIFVADTANNRVQKFTSAGVHSANIGSQTGCRGVAVDSSGNVYATLTGGTIKKYSSALALQWTSTAFGAEFVHLATDGSFVWATTANHTIAKYAASDGALCAILAGPGTGDGQFATPFGIAYDGTHLYVVDQGNSRVQKLQPNQSYSAQVGASGTGNGQFASLRGIAVDGSGNVWACDEDNERVQTFSAALAYSAQFGASGSGDGQFASNNGPYDLAVAPDGTLWVVDRGNNRVQQFDSSGAYLAKIDSIGGSTAYAFASKFGADGAGNGQFNAPWQCALDSSGNLYVADANNNRVQKFDASGAFVSAITSLSDVRGVAVDSSNNVYVAYNLNDLRKYNSSHVTQWTQTAVGTDLRHIATDGTHLYCVDVAGHKVWKRLCSTGAAVTSWGSNGAGNGQFVTPYGIAYNASNGFLYVADQGNDRVQYFTTAGAYQGQWGSTGTGDGQFGAPLAVAINSTSGHVYVSDISNDRVQEFTATGAFVRRFGESGSGDGQFGEPRGLAANSSGDLWVADFQSGAGDRIQKLVLAVSTSGLSAPTSVDIKASSGRLYVADDGNDRILYFSSAGVYEGTWGTAGSGTGQFDGIGGLAVHQATGHVYVADTGNARVQQFDEDGTFIRQWTSGTAPTGIGIAGNVFVSDATADVVREYTSAGTLVQTIGASGSGDGQFDTPVSVAFDATGNLYVADQVNNRIQKFLAGAAYVAKWGSAGSGDGQFATPSGLALDDSGDVWVCDTGNSRLQRFSNTGTYQDTIAQSTPVGIDVASGDVLWVSTGQHTLVQWDEETIAAPAVEGKAWLGAWTGTAWCALWEGSQDLTLTWMRLALKGDYALWWGDTDGVAYRQLLPPPFFNPAARVKLGVYPFAPTGWMETMRYDANMGGWDKIAAHFFAMMEYAAADVYVDISYRTDTDQFDSGLLDPPYRAWKRVDHIGRTLCRFDDVNIDDISGLPWREGEPFQWIQFRYDFARGSDAFFSPLWMWHSLHHLSVPQDSASFTLKIPIPQKPGKAFGRAGDEMAETLRALQTTRKMVHLQTRNPDPTHPEWQVFFRGRVTQVKSEFYPGADHSLDEVVVISFVEIGESSNAHTTIAVDTPT